MGDFTTVDGEWVQIGWRDGRCVKCAKPPTELGHDPCIADLPGVRYACCGHGGEAVAYCAYTDGSVHCWYEVAPDRFVEVTLDEPEDYVRVTAPERARLCARVRGENA